MHLDRLAALSPGCPACLTGHVEVASHGSGDEGQLRQGTLRCDQPDCGATYPVLDGVPVLVGDLSTVATNQILHLLQRDDLDTTTLQAIGSAAGPGSALDGLRQNLSTYTWGHWGDLDPAGDGPKEGHVLGILERGLAAATASGCEVAGPVLDLGCGLGRTSLALATATDGPVLGIDLNVSFLRAAERILRTGTVAYDLRTTGLLYEPRRFDVDVDAAGQVELWCADVQVLPVPAGHFGLVTSLNVVDCIAEPRRHLRILHDVLRPGGVALIASPFDWAPTATDPGDWIGGVDPASPATASSETTLRELLDGRGEPTGLRIVEEIDDLAWDVRLHARSTMRYTVDLFVVERV